MQKKQSKKRKKNPFALKTAALLAPFGEKKNCICFSWVLAWEANVPGERGDESSSDSTSSSSLSGSSSTLSLVHDGEVATHRHIGRPPPDHYPAPMRACHTGPRPDCYWPTLDTCSAHLQARGKGQRKAARHSGGEGVSAMLEKHREKILIKFHLPIILHLI